jgi:hypothetical protein
VAAGVPVLVMPFVVGVLMAMSLSLVAVLMTIMAMSRRIVLMLMLMFVFVMAAHRSSLLSWLLFLILTTWSFLVKLSPRVTSGHIEGQKDFL